MLQQASVGRGVFSLVYHRRFWVWDAHVFLVFIKISDHGVGNCYDYAGAKSFIKEST